MDLPSNAAKLLLNKFWYFNVMLRAYDDNMTDRNSLAETIRRKRLEHSWSQSQLAKMSRLSIRTIQRLEKEGKASHETLLSVASVFDVDVSELLKNSVYKVSLHLLKKLFISYVFILTLVTVVLAMVQKFGEENYKVALQVSGCIISIYLAVISGQIGVKSGKTVKGVLFLLAGIILSILFFLILPDIRFEYDHYSAGAAWLFNWGPVMIVILITMTLVDKLRITKNISC